MPEPLAPTAQDVPDPALAAIVAALAERGWCVDPAFLAAEEVARLAAESRALWEEGAFRQAGVGVGTERRIRPEIRRDQVLWLTDQEATPAQRRYFARVEALRRALNGALYLGLFDFEAHLTVYPPGAFYRRHLDRFRAGAARTVSLILYLNEEWPEGAGGELRLYLDELDDAGAGPHLDVPPRGGTLVAFLSDRFYHEVLPAARERLSLTGWLKTRE
jgi:SM-20-related protein